MVSLTVSDYVAFLAPELITTVRGRPKCRCPLWPADVFAVACSLLQRAGAVRSVGISYLRKSRRSRQERAEKIKHRAEEWRRHAARNEPFDQVERLWKVGVVDIWNRSVSDLGCFSEAQIDGCSKNCEALIDLCALADEVFAGYGICNVPQEFGDELNDDQIADLDFRRFVHNLLSNIDERDRLGATLCKDIDP